jgi:hypothetical protein
MPKLGKKTKKKKKVFKVRTPLFGTRKFTQASFRESARYGLETLAAALPRNTQTAPQRYPPRLYPEFYAERVQDLADRFNPEITRPTERLEPVPEELRETFATQNPDLTQDRKQRVAQTLFEDQLPFRSTPLLESASLPDLVRPSPVLNRLASSSLPDRPLVEEIDSNESVYSDEIERLPRRNLIFEDDILQEDYSLQSEGFRDSGEVLYLTTPANPTFTPKYKPTSKREIQEADYREQTERINEGLKTAVYSNPYIREDLDTWSGEALQRFAKARIPSLQIQLGGLRKGTIERERVLDRLFAVEDSIV